MMLGAVLVAELAGLGVDGLAERRAEVASLLRFAGGLQLDGSGLAVVAAVDTAVVAQRLRGELRAVFDSESEIRYGAGLRVGRHGPRYLVRVGRGAEQLARRTGLLDSTGRPVRGLPPTLIGGSRGQAAGVWRGALLARGSLTQTGRSAALAVVCPGPEAALALVGTARRLEVRAVSRQVRDSQHVIVRDGSAITDLLQVLGATASAAALAKHLAGAPIPRQVREFTDSNRARSAEAATSNAAAVRAALDQLGNRAPALLLEAGSLRLAHPQASLRELGARAVPPMSKDAIAGRLRRLIALAR